MICLPFPHGSNPSVPSVVYSFVQWSLQANELSYESTVRFHWPPAQTTPWDNAYLWFPDLLLPSLVRAHAGLLLVGADSAS